MRDFQQIAGRAGRKGYDDRGDVWVQAPPHVVENLRSDEKNAATGKKSVKKKPPERGYAHWSQDTFDKLVGGEPEQLRSHFQVNHQMVMSLLDRPEWFAGWHGLDGCASVRRLMVDNHETRKRQRGHILRAISIYRSLVEADLLEFPDPPDEYGRRVRVNFDLQDEFALHQPLSLWALEAIDRAPRPARGAGAAVRARRADDHRVGAGEPGRDHRRPDRPRQDRADGRDEGGRRRVRGADRAAQPGRGAQAEQGLDLQQLQRVPGEAPVGRQRHGEAEVDRARHVGARDDVHRVRQPLRAEAVGGCGAALPVRRLQGPDAEHPRGRPHRGDRRPHRLARCGRPPGRLEPDRRMGTPAEPDRDRPARSSGIRSGRAR